MANTHRQYDISVDAYLVRVEGTGPDGIYSFSGRNAEKDSYAKLRQLTAIEQKKDKSSQMIDHARPT